MNAYISNDLNMVKELDPMRHELALKMEAFLNKGGTIEVLPFWVAPPELTQERKALTPNFQSCGASLESDAQAARIRKMAETLNGEEICEKEGISRGVLRGIIKRYRITLKAGPRTKTAAAIRQETRREIEREMRAAERIAERKSLIERIRALAAKLNYSQAIMVTGMSRKVLYALAKEGGFSFQPSGYTGRQNLRAAVVDEAKDAKNAERIKAFKKLGLTRNQAMEKAGISFTAFTRILAKFEIDYPKSKRGGPRPAFRPKAPKQ